MLKRVMSIFEAAILGLVVSFGLMAMVLMIRWSPLWSQEAAGWVQAIGSIGAILVAVWVSSDQQRKQRRRDDEREREEVQHMLRSIRDEMYIAFNTSKKMNGKHLSDSEEGTPFLFKIPFAERPFPIFEAYSDKLGKIPDDELRKLIIVGHTRAIGMVLSIRYNNGLVEKFEYVDHMARVMNDHPHHLQKQLIEQQLCSYGDLLRGLYKEACQHIEEMIGALDKYLSKP